jgi:hypothetical protein
MLCRLAAQIPTSGSGSLDQMLVTLAAQLDHDAAALERELESERQEAIRARG